MYDVNNASDEAISIDGTYIEDAVAGYRTLSVSGRESLAYTITDEDRPVGTDGMEYYGKRQQSRTITVRFELSAPSASAFMARYRKLKDFCKGEGRKLRFADEPNAHYTGTLSSVDAPEPGSLRVVAEMAFYCADPYLESDVITTVTASVVDGKLTAHVVNDGSGEVYPTYRITHGAENGYLGIVHPGGAFEMGNRDEVDQEAYKRSETLAVFTDVVAISDDSGINYMHPNHIMGGALIAQTISGRQCLRLNSTGTETNGRWCGGMRTLTLPVDSEGVSGSKNFYCYLNWWFESGIMGQTGELSVAFLTADNKVICGYSLYKVDQTGNIAALEFRILDEIYKSEPFATFSYYDQNPFIMENGNMDIRKEGDKITFHWWYAYPSFSDPVIAEMKCSKIQIAFTQFAGRGLGNKYMTRNYLRDLKFQKLNVEKWKDVPNRYTAGSEAVVNTATDAITVNGLPRNDELVTGSVFAPLPPGETDVEFYPSSWCSANPTVTVEFKKRWL